MTEPDPESVPRVLHVMADPRPYGPQRLARDLHAELRRRGRPSELCALTPDALAAAGRAVLGSTRHHPAALRALRAAARRADVVVAHGAGALPACAVAVFGTGRPYVSAGLDTPRRWTAGRGSRLRTGLLLRRAGAVTAPAEGARAVLLERFRLAPDQVVTLPDARAADRYPPAVNAADRRAARASLGLPPYGPLVAWVGALDAGRRPDLAVRVAAGVPGVHLALAGSGPLAVPAAPGVTLLGELPDPATLYRAADALLLTSAPGAGAGLPGVLIEAALAGLPCAATDVGWVREVVRPGITGGLARHDDPAALSAALDSVLAGAGTLGPRARAHALARFELAVVTDAWELLLAAVAAGCRPGRAIS
ncbi:glycosyltransferase family 4 protein [Kitasatospora sp. NPDC052896]|uniref:glycosyltransferase family 4 protein n=1 Tax=Kitasatospora sp. NPDC052896 TaxID=3364061 RepID=UPI0037C55501